MTAEFEQVMRLTGAAARGTSAAPPTVAVDWKKVFALAHQQQILPLVCLAAQTLHPCPNVLPMVLSGCARCGAVISLLGEMNDHGIPCYVVKGFAAGRHYAAPEYRLSGDTDIVVAPQDEARACAFLAQHGFSVSPRWEHGHHAVATHPKMGIVEVHTRLYDELVGEVWFQGLDEAALLREPLRLIQTPDGTYQTPGASDHAIFMALHMVKHFILSGNSLRMMTDVALALADTRERVDTVRFWQTMKALHYDTLLRSVLWAMILYCGFAPEDFPGLGECDGECVRLLLDDLEMGGWLGKNGEQAREDSWHEYNRQLLIRQKSTLSYRLYMLNWAHSFRLRTLFPERARLARDYPAVKRHAALLPFAWLHRLIFRGLPLLFGKAWTKPIVREGDAFSAESQARLALFRRLNMLE